MARKLTVAVQRSRHYAEEVWHQSQSFVAEQPFVSPCGLSLLGVYAGDNWQQRLSCGFAGFGVFWRLSGLKRALRARWYRRLRKKKLLKALPVIRAKIGVFGFCLGFGALGRGF